MIGQGFRVAIGCVSAITIAHTATRHKISMGFTGTGCEKPIQVEITVECLNVQFGIKPQHPAGKYRELWAYETTGIPQLTFLHRSSVRMRVFSSPMVDHT